MGSLYRHQVEAMEALRAGEDIVVSTPTASGKSLCYDLPVLQAIAEDPSARALYLFPTKALSQDQLAERPRAGATGRTCDLQAGVYDGDTPGADPRTHPRRGPGRGHQPGHAPRRDPAPSHQVVPAVRAAALHRHRRGAHLPRHLRQPRRQRAAPAAPAVRPLRLRAPDRLLLGDDRQSRRSWPRPSPAGDAGHRPQRRAGRREARRRPQPAGASTARTGVRPGPLGLARPVLRSPSCAPAARPSCSAGRASQVELLLTSLREALREGRGPLERVRGYRGGYLPTERRAIEAGLRTRRGPGRREHQRARAGHRHRSPRRARSWPAIRAPSRGPGSRWAGPGRRQERRASRSWSPAPAPSTSTSRPTRTTCSTRRRGGAPRPREPARPAGAPPGGDVRAAVRQPGDRSAVSAADDLLAFLAEEGHVRQADDQRWYWASENFPASEISLRVAAPENVVIIDTGPDRGRGSSARSTCSRPRRSSTRTRSTSTSRASTTSTGSTGTSARRTCARSTSTTTPRRSSRSRSSRWRCSRQDDLRRGDAHPRRGDGLVASRRSTRSSSSRPTRTSAGAGSTCPRSSCTPPPGGWPRPRRPRSAGVRDDLDRGTGRRRAGAADGGQRAAHERPARPRRGRPGPVAAPRSGRSSTCGRRCPVAWGSPPPVRADRGAGRGARWTSSTGCDCDSGCPACVGPAGDASGGGTRTSPGRTACCGSCRTSRSPRDDQAGTAGIHGRCVSLDQLPSEPNASTACVSAAGLTHALQSQPLGQRR